MVPVRTNYKGEREVNIYWWHFELFSSILNTPLKVSTLVFIYHIKRVSLQSFKNVILIPSVKQFPNDVVQFEMSFQKSRERSREEIKEAVLGLMTVARERSVPKSQAVRYLGTGMPGMQPAGELVMSARSIGPAFLQLNSNP